MQWNQTRSPKSGQTTGIKEYVAEWYRPGAGSYVSLNAIFEGEAPAYADVLRIACHHAIEQLPDDGLVELSQTLDEMLDYYTGKDLFRDAEALKLTSTEPAMEGASFVRDHFQLAEL